MSDEGDRRAAERIPVISGTTCSFVAPVIEDFGTAKIRDVSLDGVGLILLRKVELGTTLAIGLSNPTKGFAKTVMVKVVHVTPVHGGFLVGGQFTAPLSYLELTTLVM